MLKRCPHCTNPVSVLAIALHGDYGICEHCHKLYMIERKANSVKIVKPNPILETWNKIFKPKY